MPIEPTAPNQFTYRDPTLSLWQSAVAQVRRNHASVQARAASIPGQLQPATLTTTPPVALDLMAPAHAIGAPLSSGRALPAAIVSPPLATPHTAGLLGVALDCAEVAAKFLWAEITGNQQNADLYAGQLKDSVCDPEWVECVTTYLGFKLSAAAFPYRPNQNVVLDLPRNATIAILGDWGTGDAVAINVLKQVATFKPDILLHLGDVYYSGTHSESNDNFLAICRNILGPNVPLYSLCGNHDMYSGGDGYYWLVDQIGQRSSYFALQNDDWLFLAMDTGHNDHDPFTVATNMTSLVNIPGWSEASWHLSKIQQAGGRRIAAFSHHQLFSPFASVGSANGQGYAYNPNLFGSFQSVLPKIDVWFWGHEHTLALYDPYMGLPRGRCVGASAVPVFTDQQQYAGDPTLITYQNAALPSWNPSAILGNQGKDYNNAFAIMAIDGATATVNYYQVPILGIATQLPFTDTI